MSVDLQALNDLRTEVREFCRTEMPADLRARSRRREPLQKADVVDWERRLARKGWYAGHWPRAHGGLGWTRLQRFVFIEALELEGAPWLTPFGVEYLGPVLYTYGSAEQQRRWLPPILSCETFWCQGFSEPDAGSDLASVRTRADRCGDHFLVNGQKTWTTMAHWADMMFALVRTESTARARDGLSLLLIDLHAPGVTVRPIRTLDLGCEFCEVFLDNVVVPADHLVGRAGDGWRQAKLILAHERPLAVELGKAKRMLGELHGLVTDLHATRRAQMAHRLAELEVRTRALEALAHGLLQSGADAEPMLADAAILKLRGSQLRQAMTECAMELLGGAGLAYEWPPCGSGSTVDPPGGPLACGLVREHLYGRAATIYGGTSEIQHEILAASLLGR